MNGEKRVIGMVAACPFPSSQGSQVLIRQLSRSLAHRGHSVHIITYPLGDLPPDPYYTLHRAKAIVPYKKLDPGPSILKPFLDIMLLARVISVVRREKVDLLHGHNYEGVLVAWAAARLLGIPVIYHCHSLLIDELPTYSNVRSLKWLARCFGDAMDRITTGISDHTIAVSPETIRRLEKRGVKDSRLTLLPPGIVPEEWVPRSPIEGEETRGPKIVYTGNLAGFQNIPHLVEVIRKVRPVHPDVVLEVITPSDTSKLSELSRSAGIERNLSIIVENDFHTIGNLLQRADIACSTRTMKSGFPIKILNYMAAGLPTVCYESGATGVIDGETGIVVEDNNIAKFSEAVLSLLRDVSLRKKMGVKAREIVFRDYNLDGLILKAEEVYKSLVGKTG
jgi:glycosyltransferase involved in cell wall biosynthesis